jgi:hypothetical protein
MKLFTGDNSNVLSWQVGFDERLPMITSAPAKAKEGEKYFNLFGKSFSLGDSKVDETAAQGNAYADVAAEFPFYTEMDCNFITNTISNIDARITQKKNELAAGTTDRVGQRYLTAYNTRRTEFVQMSNNMGCAKLLEQQDNQDFLDTQYTQLQRVQTLSTQTSSTATYVIFAVLGLGVAVTLYVLLKKK